MSAFLLRTFAAALLLPVAISAVAVGGSVFLGVITAVSILLGLEWDRMIRQESSLVRGSFFCLFILAALVTSSSASDIGQIFVNGAVFLALMIVALILLRVQFNWYAAGFIWFYFPCALIVFIREQHELGFLLTLWLLVVVWVCDTLAYLVGRTVGGMKLAPRVSPNKTWSGFIGGVSGASIVGPILGFYGLPGEFLELLLASAVVEVFSQIGDLTQSSIKRRFLVKDTGNLIPGHGGIFDRLDGILFAVPVATTIVFLNDGAGGLW